MRIEYLRQKWSVLGIIAVVVMLANIPGDDAVGCNPGDGCATCGPCATGCSCDQPKCGQGQYCCPSGECVGTSCDCGDQGCCTYEPSLYCPAHSCYDIKCKYCNPITGPKDIKILSINGPDKLEPGGYGDYGITTEPTITSQMGYTVVWSGGDDYIIESQPAVALKIGFWTCDTKTITVTVNGCVTKTKSVNVTCDANICCYKHCCDTNQCMDCVGGMCKGCDPDKCEDCNATSHACEVCQGDSTLKCYNGHCCCAPNGCGPCHGPHVPDNPTGCPDTSFLGPCNAHDDCYSTCGSNKTTCDENLWEELTEICSMAASDCVARCTQNANIYYNAVSGWGQSAWEAAQACSCGT
jgi:hypothetical protein